MRWGSLVLLQLEQVSTVLVAFAWCDRFEFFRAFEWRLRGTAITILLSVR